jgi:hypothetical protein
LRGKVHAVACRDLFTSLHPHVNEQAFEVSWPAEPVNAPVPMKVKA